MVLPNKFINLFLVLWANEFSDHLFGDVSTYIFVIVTFIPYFLFLDFFKNM